jgi:lipoprotein-anchoring transpeptidase ErfK/SrfK
VRTIAAASAACALSGGGATAAGAATTPGPPTRAAAWIARLVGPTPVWHGPAPRRALTTLGAAGPWTGGPVGLLVLGMRRDRVGRRWLRVALPERPNGRSGWIAADRVALARTRWRVIITVHTRTLVLLDGGRAVLHARAVVGAAGTPTPTGRFAVYERARQRDPHGFLGPWALHLTGHSDVLDNYGGGPGRVALHGRDGASLRDPLGSARSHGCVRIDDRVIALLARRLSPGAPVTIRP